MSTRGRKSSLGTTRRGPPKAHVPYRADDLNVGKRTGVQIKNVELHSDGFEPFDQFLTQADERTPPNLKQRKKAKAVLQDLDEDDSEEEEEDQGEVSMDIDSPNTPAAYFSHARQPLQPSSLNRVGSSSRPVARSSNIDFDSVPSPKARNNSTARAGPSSLRKSVANAEPDFGGGEEYDDGGSSPTHASFTAMDQDDDQEEEEQPKETQKSKKNSKGKEKARVPTEDPSDQETEADIAQGLQNVEEDPDEEDEEDQEPTPKKVKIVAAKKPAKTAKKQEDDDWPKGTRQSTRQRWAPLEFWRQERFVYGRSSTGTTLVPHIKEVIHIPPDPVVPLGSNKRKRANSTKPQSKSKPAQKEAVLVFDPEEGWDDDTEEYGTVVDYVTREETERRLAFTAKMVNMQPAADEAWYFQKVFGDHEFIAAGQLMIPPKSRKPSKGSKDNTYVFYVIEGAVNLKVHQTSLVLATGGMCMVPRGNTYFIENISDRAAKLFFTQARKTGPEEETVPARGRRSSTGSNNGDAGPSRAKSAAVNGKKGPRSSSVGPGLGLPSTAGSKGKGEGGSTGQQANGKISRRAMSTRN